MADDLAVVLGKNVRLVRAEIGATLDEIARAARKYGMKWTPQRVKAIETGKASVTVPLVLTLGWVLSEVGDTYVYAADLLASEGDIEVNPGLVVDGRAATATLRGDRAHVDARGDDFPRLTESAKEWPNLMPTDGPGATAKSVGAALRTTGLADERVANRLGISMWRLAAESVRLWGRGFSDEASRRAGEDASPQAKGHVTRALEAEIRKELYGND